MPSAHERGFLGLDIVGHADLAGTPPGVGLAEIFLRQGIDVVVGGSQKSFMIPPGLAFMSVSPKAWALAESSTLPPTPWTTRVPAGVRTKPFARSAPSVRIRSTSQGSSTTSGKDSSSVP